MERTYQIKGLDFTLREVHWRYQDETQIRKGLLLRDNRPPCIFLIIPRDVALPQSAEDALVLIQTEQGESVFSRDAFGQYILSTDHHRNFQ